MSGQVTKNISYTYGEYRGWGHKSIANVCISQMFKQERWLVRIQQRDEHILDNNKVDYSYTFDRNEYFGSYVAARNRFWELTKAITVLFPQRIIQS